MAPEMRLRVVSLPATDQQHEEEVELELVELVALDLGLGEHAEQVVLGVEPLLFAQLVGVGEQLHRPPAPGVGASSWYSGSSEPIMRLDQSKTRWRSSWGTPIRSAMTWRGSSAEICSTKSAVPVLAHARR